MAASSGLSSSWSRSRSRVHPRPSLASDATLEEQLSSTAGRRCRSATTAPWYRIVPPTWLPPTSARTSCTVGVTTSAGVASPPGHLFRGAGRRGWPRRRQSGVLGRSPNPAVSTDVNSSHRTWSRHHAPAPHVPTLEPLWTAIWHLEADSY